MRKLIVCNIMSPDGYYTGPGMMDEASTPITPNGCAQLIRCYWDVFLDDVFRFFPAIG